MTPRYCATRPQRRRDQSRFGQGVLAVRVFAGRQETVHVADDGKGAACILLNTILPDAAVPAALPPAAEDTR
jgi:hypothetical protein